MLAPTTTALAAGNSGRSPARWASSIAFAAARPEGLQGSLFVCHGLSYIAFRNLAEAGGPGYSVPQAAAFASDYKIKDGPDDKARCSSAGPAADYFPSPFRTRMPHVRQWRRGAADLSLIHQGAFLQARLPDCSWLTSSPSTRSRARITVAAVLQGYENKAPRASRFPKVRTTNKYFPRPRIKMPKPLSDGQVTFDDGAPATVAQYARTSPRS